MKQLRAGLLRSIEAANRGRRAAAEQRVAAEVDSSTVSKYMRGKKRPSREKFERLVQ